MNGLSIPLREPLHLGGQLVPGGHAPPLPSPQPRQSALDETVTVDVTGDTTVEKSETFNLVLSTPTPGTVLSDASGTDTIVNDDI